MKLLLQYAYGLVVLLQLAASNKTADPSARISYGARAKHGQIPYIVQLRIPIDNMGNGYLCGGSILDHNWVLTAAHCINKKLAAKIIYGGDQPLAETELPFWAFHTHPKYDALTLENDIALIRTPWVRYTRFIKPIALPFRKYRNQDFADEVATASGWGYTEQNIPSTTLQTMDEKLVSRKKCKKSFPGLRKNVICLASPNGHSVCNGDSGGPLVLKNVPQIIGVASFVHTSGCLKGHPAGFTNVAAFLDWIQSVISKNG